MRLDCLANVSLGLLDSFPIAEAAGLGGAVGKVTFVLGLFFDHNLERIEFHATQSSSGMLNYTTSPGR